MYYFCYQMIIGDITICANKDSVTRLHFGAHLEPKVDDIQNAATGTIKKAFMQLDEYLNGERKRFDVKLGYSGSDFQMSVWNQLRQIPYGNTKTYKEIACNIGNPRSSLAVGGACGKNPIPIFIPCHRVIGSNGDLTGYAGGVNLKKQLLEIESHNKCN